MTTSTSTGGSALPCVLSTDAPISGPALQVVRDDAPTDRAIDGGSALPIVLITDDQVAAGYPVQGNTPVAIAVVSDGRAALGGRPQPVYVVGGSGPTPPDPNLPMTGYALWLNPTYRANSAYQDAARTIPAGVGDPVGGLYDPTTGITATASGTDRPTLGTNGLIFSGTQFLAAAIGPRGTQTIYVVARFDVGEYRCLFGSPSIDEGWLIASADAPYRHVTMVGSNVGVTIENMAVGLGERFVACAVFAGAASVLRVNTTEVSNASVLALNGSDLVIGKRGAAGGYLIGEIREILIYSGAHDAPTRAAESAKAFARCADAPPPSTVVFFGDSMTAGELASDAAHRWATIVAAAKGYATVVNAGISGTVLQNTTPTLSNNGRDTYSTRVTASSPGYVYILYGYNDMRYNGASFSVANYQNDLGEVIDGIVAGGVRADNIVIGSPAYSDPAFYGLYAPFDAGSTPSMSQRRRRPPLQRARATPTFTAQ